MTNLFEYPIDAKQLLRKKAAVKKELLNKGSDWIEKKIAVLGGSTTNEVTAQLELFLLYNGIKPEFYQSEYGQYWQDSVFGTPQLDEFSPDAVYIHTSWRNITRFPQPDSTPKAAEQMLHEEFERLQSMWQALEERYQCLIIQNNFDRPNYRLLGNRDIWERTQRILYQ
ncbi:MAG: hypothetical protein Q4B42_01845 [Oscillospiraceae bacterium]|nr:hypothetical protein [Oscillospiraceae bacterium]